MIYKDDDAKYDTMRMPQNRGGYKLCLNCGNSWNHHHGWSCVIQMAQSFDLIVEDKRYLTQSMKDSISKPRKIIPDFPIDTSLPLLEAGHLQDRMRKRHKG